MKRSIGLYFLLFLIIGLSGCNLQEMVPVENMHITIHGYVEKGPFDGNSEIQLYELDESLTRTENNFLAYTWYEDCGYYSIYELITNSPYIEVVTVGDFFDEVTGRLSDDKLMLKAFADMNEGYPVNVNVFTHLIYKRVQYLMLNEGFSYLQAQMQAGEELLTVFGLQRLAGKELNKVSLNDRSELAAALLVVSSTLLAYCDHSVPGLAFLLERLADELCETGSIAIREELRIKSTQVDWDAVERNLKNYYNEVSKSIAIRDLKYYVDWNGSGIAGSGYEPPQDVYIRLEVDTLHFSVAGGIERIKIESSVRYTFPLKETFPPYFPWDLGVNRVHCSKKLTEDDYLEISVSPAPGLLMQGRDVIICDVDETIHAVVHITQDGDFTKEFPTETTQSSYFYLLKSLWSAYVMDCVMEAAYTNMVEVDQPEWIGFNNHLLEVSNPVVKGAYEFNSTAISTFTYWREMVYDFYPDLLTGQAAFEYLRALAYYQAAVLWGNIVYLKDRDGEEYEQMDEKELLNRLEPGLKKAIDILPETKNKNMIFVSRATPQGILGKMYLQTGKYAKALEEFDAIIQTGSYQVESSLGTAVQSNSRELIYSFPENGLGYSYYIYETETVPVLLYSDILFSAAECAYQLGNKQKAIEYINEVLKGRAEQLLTQLDSMEVLSELWREQLSGTFTWFAFLKRNNLAGKYLGIEPFRELFPIPPYEFVYRPGVIQNPGYN